jgi:alkanesulfonate monooxygenase SsuD/methylene tetrahydromethanopterin reductase-like flavin-dependent oxidoreductase (luciferase family)
MHGNPKMKIYTASIAPASIRNSAEVADGMFPVFMNPQRFGLLEPHLNAGFAKSGGQSGKQKSLMTYDVCPFVPVSMGDDLDAARLPIKQHLALYIGGMGARDKNFYHDYAKRLGYDTAAIQIQDAYLAGRKADAVAAVPDALVDEIALVGSADRIRDRLQAWKDAGKQRHVDAMLLSGNADTETLRVIAEAVL